jgi:hypothetical protein
MNHKPVVALALLAAATVACSETTTAPSKTAPPGTNNNESQAWTAGSLAILANEGVTGLRSPTQTVIDDEPTWQAMWQSIYATRLPQPELPAVDFASHSVVVYGLGDRYATLQLDSITQSDAGSAAFFTATVPGSTCIVPAVVLSPAIAVDVPQRITVQTWSLRTVVHECS